jgi:hypothetical protein
VRPKMLDQHTYIRIIEFIDPQKGHHVFVGQS